MTATPAPNTAFPACPSCGYDLTGIIREDNTATCPECGEELDIIPTPHCVSRWDPLAALLCIQFLLNTGACLLVFVIRAGAPFLSMGLTLAVIPACAIRFEHRRRKQIPALAFTPKLWLVTIIVLLHALTFVALTYLILLWIAFSSI